MVTLALASLALQSVKKLFQKSNLENKRVILYLELTFAHKALVLIATRIGDLTDFFPGHFLRQWNLTTVSSAAQMEGVYVR